MSTPAVPAAGTRPAVLRPVPVDTEIELFSVAGHDGALRQVNGPFA